MLSSPILRFQEKRLADLTAKYHLPAIYQRREFVDAGGLMAYGPSDTEFFRRAADFVARILRGAKPADLPVERPTKFELVINVTAAKTLGLTFPQSIVARADAVVR